MRVGAPRRLHQRRAKPLLPVVEPAGELTFDILHELVHLALHLLHLPAHVENDLDAGEIHAQVPRQREDGFELLEIFFGVQARVPLRSRWLQEAFALVEPERLRMNVIPLGHRTDHEIGLAGVLGHLMPQSVPGRFRR